MEIKLLKSLLWRSMIFFAAFCLFGAGTAFFSSTSGATEIPAGAEVVLNTDLPKEQEIIAEQENPLDEGETYIFPEQIKNTEEIEERLGKHYIRVAKQQEDLAGVKLQDLYWKNQVVLYFHGLKQESVTVEDIEWISPKENIRENRDRKCEISFEDTVDAGVKAEIVIPVDKIYGYVLYEDSEYIYIACRKPKEVYKKIIVLDGGHGGSDTGSYAIRGKWTEKDYNLDFVQRIEKNWDNKEVKLYVTRMEDTKLSLGQRVNLANQVQADLFVSVHCNSTDENGGTGVEALYKTNAYAKTSKKIATLCLEQLQAETGFFNRGLLDGQRIYILRNAKMPAILLELGFLSEPKDCEYLNKEENRERMAQVLCQVLEKGLE